MIENNNSRSSKFNIPVIGEKISLAKEWRFRCDYITVNYSFWHFIGFPASRPIFNKTFEIGKIIYSFQQDLPSNQIVKAIDLEFVLLGTRTRQNVGKPLQVYDIFSCLVTLPKNSTLTIVAVSIRKQGRITFRIDECEIRDLEGQIFSVEFNQAYDIEYNLR